jgi:hypothetical protein
MRLYQHYSIYKYNINANFDITISATEETTKTTRFLVLITEMASGYSKFPRNEVS